MQCPACRRELSGGPRVHGYVTTAKTAALVGAPVGQVPRNTFSLGSSSECSTDGASSTRRLTRISRLVHLALTGLYSRPDSDPMTPTRFAALCELPRAFVSPERRRIGPWAANETAH